MIEPVYHSSIPQDNLRQDGSSPRRRPRKRPPETPEESSGETEDTFTSTAGEDSAAGEAEGPGWAV
jgi:hypothetical protein